MNDYDVDKILKILELAANEKMPKSGIVAGQAVAEAYFQAFNLSIQTRIKDIDIFWETTPPIDFKCNVDSFKFHVFGSAKINNYKTASYSDFQFNVIDAERVRIVSSVEIGKFNFIETLLQKRLEITKHNKTPYLVGIVESFDLNIVQIGIDLATKKLYKTKHFDEFLKNKQMIVVNFCSPLTTLLRLIEKNNEFNVYCNVDYEAQLLISKLILISRRNQPRCYIRGLYITDRKLNSYSKRTLKEVCKYFSFKNFMLNGSLLKKSSPIKKALNRKTYNKIQYIKESIKGLSTDLIVLDRDFYVGLLKPDFYKKATLIFEMSLSAFQTLVYRPEILNIKKSHQLAIFHHYALFTALERTHTLTDVGKFILFLENNKLRFVIGFFEAGKKGFDKILSVTELKKLLLIERTKSLKEYQFSVGNLNDDDSDFSITQLKTQLDLFYEGEQMLNCIGGYFETIKEGKILVFSVKHKTKFNNRVTVAIIKAKDSYIVKEVQELNNGVQLKNKMTPAEKDVIGLYLADICNKIYKRRSGT